MESQKAEVESSLTKADSEPPKKRAASCCTRPICDSPRSSGATIARTAEQLRALLAKHIPDSQATGTRTHCHRTSPICAASSGTTTSTCWNSSAAVFSGHGVSVVDGAFTSNGQLVTLDQNGQVRRWDLGSQDEDEASRRDLPGGASAQVRVLSPDGRLAALAEGNKVHVFDTSTGKETFQIDSANTTTSAV